MKKLLIIAIISIIILILGLMLTRNLFLKKKNTFNENLNYTIIDSGYISDFDKMIISNIEEYNLFMKDSNDWNRGYKQKILSNNYDENYFQNNSLALIFICTGNSDTKLIDVKLLCNNNTLFVKTNIYDPHTFIEDITGELLLVEIDKSITDIIVY